MAFPPQNPFVTPNIQKTPAAPDSERMPAVKPKVGKGRKKAFRKLAGKKGKPNPFVK
jgi:hypothetical protein